MQSLAIHHPVIHRFLSDLAHRWRRLVALRALGAALAVLAGFAAVECIADRFAHFDNVWRCLFLAMGVVLACAVGIIRLAPIRGSIDWVAVASVIEAFDPRFGQRLVTVTSRLLGPADCRGSDEILSHLVREVEGYAEAGSPGRILRLRTAARPWAVLGLIVVLMCLAGQLPAAGAPQLLLRLAAPRADIPPVTTTQLHVQPGDVDVPQAQPLHIDVQAARLGASPVWLFLSDEAGAWSRYTLDDAGGGQFTFTVSSVSRDFRYYVSAGDAVSATYGVRVKRPPAVAEFRVQYTYPSYTGKPPAAVVNSDGVIEAPVGSEAVLTIVATEPLQSALLTLGDQKILMDRPGDSDDNTLRRAVIKIDHDLNYDLDLISTREVRGSGPRTMTIRATADRPPLVRLHGAGQTLTMRRADVLSLNWQAADDFGVEALWLATAVNASAPSRTPLPIGRERRRIEDVLRYDLAWLGLDVGDVVGFTLIARDTAGHEVSSDELRVLICPNSVEPDALKRVDELSSASRFAGNLGDELDGAGRAIDDAMQQRDRSSAAFVSASADATRRLAEASESAAVLRQCLLRAASHSAGELAGALAAWVDDATVNEAAADELFRRAGSSQGIDAPSRQRIGAMTVATRELASHIHAASQGERAAVLMAEHENLRAISAALAAAPARTSDRLTAAVQQLTDDVAASASLVDVDLAGVEAESLLRHRVDAGLEAERSAAAVDWPAAAGQWARAATASPRAVGPLDVRLASAAAAEALRKDADLVRAHDLEMASRTATALAQSIASSPAGKAPSAELFAAFVHDLEALGREHNAVRGSASGKSKAELVSQRQAAQKAREDLARQSGEIALRRAAGPLRPGDLDALALDIGAIASRRDYARAADQSRLLSQRLLDAARKPGGRAIEDASPAAALLMDERLRRINHVFDASARLMTGAEAIDHLAQVQEKLLTETRSGKFPAHDLAARQAAAAEQTAALLHQRDSIAKPMQQNSGNDDGDGAARAMAAVLAVRRALAPMPAALTASLDAMHEYAKMVDRLHNLARAAETAPADRRAAAKALADAAAKDAAAASRKLASAAEPLAPKIVEDAGQRLDALGSDGADLKMLLTGSVNDELTNLQPDITELDIDAVNFDAARLRQALGLALREAAAAQLRLTEHDPLLQALFEARLAADELSRPGGDARAGAAHQSAAVQSLWKTWEKSMRQASDLRLSAVPGFTPIYGPLPIGVEPALAGRSPTAIDSASSPLQAGAPDDLSSVPRDVDPPGYEEALRLYFEVLNKSQERAKP